MKRILLGVMALALVSLAVVLAGAGAPGVSEALDPPGAAVTDIDSATLVRLRRASAIPVVDIRRPDEWTSTGVIAGSRLVTLFEDTRGRVNPDFMPTFARIAAPGDPVILVCRSGRRTAALADRLVRTFGYSRVYSLQGGILGWLDSGLDLVAPTCPQC